jgi:hypothetical protein
MGTTPSPRDFRAAAALERFEIPDRKWEADMADSITVQRTLTEQVRKHIYWQNGTLRFLFFTGLAWAAAGAYFFLNFNVFEWWRHHDGSQAEYPYIYLALAIGTPIGSAIWGWLRIRRALYLAEHGIEVTARVTSLGIGASFSRNVHYEYTIGSRVVADRMSMPKDVAQGLYSGKTPFLILVDPKKPEQFMRKTDVFPAEGS